MSEMLTFIIYILFIRNYYNNYPNFVKSSSFNIPLLVNILRADLLAYTFVVFNQLSYLQILLGAIFIRSAARESTWEKRKILTLNCTHNDYIITQPFKLQIF